MVEQKICSFCGGSIEPGTGRLFVRKDGFTYSFCSNKCFSNMTVLKKIPRDTRWTSAYVREKEIRLVAESHVEKQVTAKKSASKVRRVAKQKKGDSEKPAKKKESLEKKKAVEEMQPLKKEATLEMEKGDEN